MTAYTYTLPTPGGTEKVDVCAACREKLGLPKSGTDRIRVDEGKGAKFRNDPCMGCGGPASGFAEKFGRPFDGEEEIRAGSQTTRDADALAQMLNMADELDIFVTVDAETEEVPVATNDEGEAFAKVMRQVPDSPKGLHIRVLNSPDREDDRDQMEERCRKLERLLALNGWDGAPRPKPAGEDDDRPDWEIWAVPN